MRKKIVAGLVLALLPGLTMAHPGHAEGGFTAAFAHPFTGVDHLLMMLFIGVWAGRNGCQARWQVPLVFLLAMASGWALAAQGLAIPDVETGIAASLIALGALLIARAPLPRSTQLVITASFALLHGMAHGIELGALTPALSAAGFLCAGALLHGSGILLSTWLPKDGAAIYRALGATLALIGGGLLIA